jgi:hypothetical protein
MSVRKASTSLQSVVPNVPFVEKEMVALDSQRGTLDWQGKVRLVEDRAAGISAASWQQHLRKGLLERALVLGADHCDGPHVERPQTALRILAHIDALAEAGLSPAEIRSFADEAELDHPGALWMMTLLFGCLHMAGAVDEFETWCHSFDAATFATYDAIVEIADALRCQPNPQFPRRVLQWLDAESETCCAIALELVSLHDVPESVLQRLARTNDSFIQVAMERLLARSPEAKSISFSRDWTWIDAKTPALAFHAARARIFLRDFDPLIRLRQRDAHVIEMLGPYALDILALTANGSDHELALDLSRPWPTSVHLLDVMGRVGLPSLFPRMLAELEGDDFDDEAATALTTALGHHPNAKSRQDWERLIIALPNPGESTRFRGGLPYSLAAIHEEMKRPELSAREVCIRADELFVNSGKRMFLEWEAFGSSLEPLLATLGTIVR